MAAASGLELRERAQVNQREGPKGDMDQMKRDSEAIVVTFEPQVDS